MTYEELLLLAERESIEILENCNIGRLKGLCINNIITINIKLKNTEKKCVLGEEMGHFHTSSGNIINQSKAENRQQERKARGWAFRKLIPLNSFVRAYREGIKNRFELAEFLNVTEKFLIDAVKYYKEKYGLYYVTGNYIIYFDPLGVEKTKGGEQVVNL